MRKIYLLLSMLILGSCSINESLPTYSPTPNSSISSSHSVVPTAVSTSIASNPSGSPINQSEIKSYKINENSNKIISDLNNQMQNTYITTTYFDKNNNLLIFTNNNTYKINNFNNLITYENGIKSANPIPYGFIYQDKIISLNEYGNGLIQRFTPTLGYTPCSSYCPPTNPYSLYKIINYKISENVGSSYINSENSNESNKIKYFYDSINGNGKLAYIDNTKNSLFLADLTNFVNYSNFKEYNYNNKLFLLGNNLPILVRFDISKNVFIYNFFDKNNNSYEFPYIVSPIYDNQNNLIYPNTNFNIDENGNGKFEIFYRKSPNDIYPLDSYIINNFKVDIDSKQTHTINIPSTKNEMQLQRSIYDQNGNGLAIYIIRNNDNLYYNNFSIYKVENYELKDKISDISNISSIDINKYGDGLAYNTLYLDYEMFGTSTNGTKIYLIKDFKIQR